MLPLNNELESCWCQKLTEHLKCILHPKFETIRTLGRNFMTVWFFNKILWFVWAAMLEVILLPSNMAAKTNFCLYPVKRLIVTIRCVVNVATSFSLKFKCKICVQKEAIHNFTILSKWPATNLLILRKWCRFEKPNHYYFV